MREAEVVFDKCFRQGLRRHYNSPRSEDELYECHNLMPTGKGLTVHEALTDLNSSGVTWGGLGKWSAAGATRDITIQVSDYIDASELQTVSVFLDTVLKGTTDADGELDIDDVAVGGHALKLTKAGYLDSDADELLNDYIVVS